METGFPGNRGGGTRASFPPVPPTHSRSGEGRGRDCAGGGLPEGGVGGVGVGLGRVEVGGPVLQRGVGLGSEGLNPQSFNLFPRPPRASQVALMIKNLPADIGDTGDWGL